MNAPTAPLRFDPLLIVHKAARQVMFEVATEVGAVDASDIFAIDRCARQVVRLIELLPESAAALAPLVDALYQRDTDARHVAAAELYGAVTALVASQLVRQQRAEATASAGQRPPCSDAELRATRRAQLAAMTERELAAAVGPLGAALTPQELAAFLDDLQASVDGQTFGCLADTLERRLEPSRWARVVRERGDPGTTRGAGPRRPGGRGADVGANPVTLHRRGHRADRQRLLAQ